MAKTDGSLATKLPIAGASALIAFAPIAPLAPPAPPSWRPTASSAQFPGSWDLNLLELRLRELLFKTSQTVPKSVPHGWFEVEDEPNLDSLLLGADVDFELFRDSSNAMDYSPTSDFWSEM